MLAARHLDRAGDPPVAHFGPAVLGQPAVELEGAVAELGPGDLRHVELYVAVAQARRYLYSGMDLEANVDLGTAVAPLALAVVPDAQGLAVALVADLDVLRVAVKRCTVAREAPDGAYLPRFEVGVATQHGAV